MQLLHVSLSLFIFNFFMFLIKWGIFVEFVGWMKSWMTFKLWQHFFLKTFSTYISENQESSPPDCWKYERKKEILVHYTELLFHYSFSSLPTTTTFLCTSFVTQSLVKVMLYHLEFLIEPLVIFCQEQSSLWPWSNVMALAVVNEK